MLTNDQILDIFISQGQLEEREGIVVAVISRQSALTIATQLLQAHHEFRPSAD